MRQSPKLLKVITWVNPVQHQISAMETASLALPPFILQFIVQIVRASYWRILSRLKVR
jgi:hypothetical protein